MRKILAILMLLTLFATTSSIAGDVDPVCVSKVESVGPAGWQEAASQMNDIEFAFHKQIQTLDLTHKKPATTAGSDWTISLLLAKKRRRMDARHVEKGNDGVLVENEEYKFGVARGKSNQENDFKLVKASKQEETGKKDDVGDDFHVVRDSLGASYSLLGLSLNQLLTSPEYKLVVAKFLGEGTTDNRPIRMEWINTSIKGQRLWVELGPQTSWMIERCGIKTPEDFEVLRTVDYQPYAQGVFPKTVATTMKFPQYTQTETLTIEPPHPCTRSDAEFYLPYYGIPESVVDVTRTNPWVRTAAIVLSLIGVAVSIYFYRSSRKPTVPKTAPG